VRAAAGEEAAKKRDDFFDAEFVGKLCLLQLDADALAKVVGVGPPIETEEFDRADVGDGEAFADFNGDGLASAIGAEKTEAFSARDFEVETVDRDGVRERFCGGPGWRGPRSNRWSLTSIHGNRELAGCEGQNCKGSRGRLE